MTKRARILRIHMEEDAGKNLHDLGAGSVVDLNRAGMPLVEIVGEPDLSSPAEAAEYLRTLRDVLVFLGINDGNLEEGSFRCDANVSIRPVGETKLGTRVELKNINSFRFVEKAIAGEIERQKEVLESRRARRAGDARLGREDGHDVLAAQQGDGAGLPLLPRARSAAASISTTCSSRARAPSCRRLPRVKRERFVDGARAHAVRRAGAHAASAHRRVLRGGGDAAPRRRACGARRELRPERGPARRDHARARSATFPVHAAAGRRDLLRLVDDGKISGKQAKELYAKVEGADAERRRSASLVAELGMAQVSDPAAIEAACAKVIADNPKQAEQYRAGKTALFGFFVGQVMKATKGSANPQLVNDTLKRLLGTSST